ncbi:MAG: DUF5028 domain-containing protein [Oscillospiraceae bacterium]|nr:DUF5028 domain-containing protein [Oscillospiraceae bacterium]
MKKKLIVIICLLGLVTYGVWVYFVNVGFREFLPVLQTYKLGQPCSFENDFFDNTEDATPGYIITVLGSELLTAREFMESCKLDESTLEQRGDELEPALDYVYAVKTMVRNDSDNQVDENGNARNGINMLYIELANTTYMNLISEFGCKIANTFYEESTFAVRPGTEIEVTFVYGIGSRSVNPENFRRDPPKLVVSHYPTKKMLETV